jgi:hypothetical protein
VHLAQSRHRLCIRAGRRRREQRLQIVVGFDVMRARELSGANEQCFFRCVAADRRE